MTWYQRRGNKYGAKKKEFNNEIYDSKKEAGYAQELELLRKGKAIKGYERQVNFRIAVNEHPICGYRADFVVEQMDGTKEIHEVKGFATEVFRLKWKLMEALYGKEYKLVLIT